MSYLKYLTDPKLDYGVSIEEFTDSVISSEDLKFVRKIKDTIRRIAEKVKETIESIFNWISNNVMSIMSRFSKSFTAKKMMYLIEKEYINEDLATTYINHWFKNVELGASVLGGSGKLFNKNGEVVNIENMYNIIKDMEEDFFKEVIEKEEVVSVYIKFIRKIYPDFDLYSNDAAYGNYVNTKYNLKSIIKTLKEFDRGVIEARKFYKERKSAVDKKYKEIVYQHQKMYARSEMQMEETENKLINVLYAATGMYAKIILLPYNFYMGFIRLIDWLTGSDKIFEYIATKNKPTARMFHLSGDKNLKDILHPRRYGSNLYEFLPPRVSFGPTVQHCLTGLNHLFNDRNCSVITEGKWKGMWSIEFFVYEGLPDKDTKYIKSNILEHEVMEWHYTKEICVLTPIRIKKLGKVKFIFDFNALMSGTASAVKETVAIEGGGWA